MDYLFCSPTANLVSSEDKDYNDTSSSDNPPSFLVESSCSEQSESSQPRLGTTKKDIPFPRPGSTSPSSILGRRKLSTAIASTADSKHPVLVGRPIVVALPELRHHSSHRGRSKTQDSTPVPASKPTSASMAIPRSAPPKAPRTIPVSLPRLNRLKGRSVTTTTAATAPLTGNASPKQVAPLPNRHQGSSSKPTLHRASSAPTQKDRSRQFRIQPSPLRLEAWSEPAAENFQVRGPTYLENRVKEPSDEAAFRLLAVDLIHCDQPIYTGMCAHPDERVQQALQRERTTGVTELPEFIFAINLVIPGNKTYHQVSYFGVDNFDYIQHPTTPFGRLMHTFIFGASDDFRNKTFKLIPRIVEGNYIVRKAVGSKPSILGKKINQYYIKGDNYFELIVDIASDSVAQRIVKLVLGYTKTMVVDMMFLLEAADTAFLPERIFGAVRLKNIDFKEKDGKRHVANP